MKTIYIWDNLKQLDNIKNNSIWICYIDPPYNTWNSFSYKDNMKKAEWDNHIEKRIKKVKTKLVKNWVVLFSISEESLFDAYAILKNNFKYIFEPLIWQTKSALNQNKVTNISAVNHEYILVASDSKIKTNLEKITNRDIITEKKKNYQLWIKLEKDMSEYPFEIINWKKNKNYKRF